MKTIQGVVSSLKMDKTAVVNVTRKWQHPLYKKFVKRSKNYACHIPNEALKLKVGDAVEIAACKPVSKTKRFKVTAKITQQS